MCAIDFFVVHDSQNVLKLAVNSIENRYFLNAI